MRNLHETRVCSALRGSGSPVGAPWPVPAACLLNYWYPSELRGGKSAGTSRSVCSLDVGPSTTMTGFGGEVFQREVGESRKLTRQRRRWLLAWRRVGVATLRYDAPSLSLTDPSLYTYNYAFAIRPPGTAPAAGPRRARDDSSSTRNKFR
ncbi:hypothetical protein EVAR_98106_1 [Eumeta japonica]|uniref:Uncharacterized protein n=1 Tax=Eumeta variegata TaxID=151549 RepID=A0A4C1XI79_EUMVA|nr:hypothetical protein EVAR_98106_1 [Eumeta japonica]